TKITDPNRSSWGCSLDPRSQTGAPQKGIASARPMTAPQIAPFGASTITPIMPPSIVPVNPTTTAPPNETRRPTVKLPLITPTSAGGINPISSPARPPPIARRTIQLSQSERKEPQGSASLMAWLDAGREQSFQEAAGWHAFAARLQP